MAEKTARPKPGPVREPDAVRVYKKVGRRELRLHIYNPPDLKRGDRRAAIVFFFGGGWVGGDIRQFFPQSAYFASRGMVAICAEYRIRSRDHTTPFECVKDGKSAIRWVRTHADELGVDPKRIAAGGGSAGGHIAACAGIVPDVEEPGEDTKVSSVPDALVLFNPVLDRSLLAERVGERASEIAPAEHVRKGLPPTIIFHGTADRVVDFGAVEQFQKKMAEAGNRCELVGYEGRDHGFFNYARGARDFGDTLRRADRFLASLGFLQGKPTVGEEAS